MRPVTQQYTKEVPTVMPGDCLRAAIASITNYALREVPHFIGAGEDHWLWVLQMWCKREGLLFVQPKLDAVRPTGLHIAVGLTERNNGPHACIADADGTIIHDPHPSRAGLTNLMARWYIWHEGTDAPYEMIEHVYDAPTIEEDSTGGEAVPATND